MFSIFIQLLFIAAAKGLIGYDCGTQFMNITTMSLINVGECDIPQDKTNVTRRYIQLLQINEFIETRVIQCKLEMRRTVFQCGMFSHASVVHNGMAEYLRDISERACQDAHITGMMRLTDKHVIHGLRVNDTIVHSVTFAGKTSTDGDCTGEMFSDHYGTWDNVVVQGTVKITLTSYTARVSLENGQIHLQSGTVCGLVDGTCLDSEGGYTFWRAIPLDSCKFDHYGILYEGYANKMINLEIEQPQTVYSLTTNDITFALTAKSKESVCGYTVIRTEHPKLVVFETIKGDTFAQNKKVSISNLDIFAYVNSKFVYVEKHIRTQMKQLYRDILIQKCNLERQTLKNALAIATQAPDEFALNLMKGPGYMAVVAGEVVHVVKCVPVEVRVEHGTDCYAELQVSKQNTTFFLTPRTHILKRRGTKITCNALLPSHYFIGETWYKILPRPTDTMPPQIIKPMTRPTWKYISPSNLATSGIYTNKDLEELRDRIMFPVEHPALLNDIVREIQGHPMSDDERTILKLLDEDTVAKLARSTWDQMWSKFMSFGTASAGIMAILMILQIIKIMVDIILRGYTLHSVFGWSTHLLGALCGSIAHFLLYKRHTSVPSEDIEANTFSIKHDSNPIPSTHSHEPPHTENQTPKSAFTLPDV